MTVLDSFDGLRFEERVPGARGRARGLRGARSIRGRRARRPASRSRSTRSTSHTSSAPACPSPTPCPRRPEAARSTRTASSALLRPPAHGTRYDVSAVIADPTPAELRARSRGALLPAADGADAAPFAGGPVVPAFGVAGRERAVAAVLAGRPAWQRAYRWAVRETAGATTPYDVAARLESGLRGVPRLRRRRDAADRRPGRARAVDRRRQARLLPDVLGVDDRAAATAGRARAHRRGVRHRRLRPVEQELRDRRPRRARLGRGLDARHGLRAVRPDARAHAAEPGIDRAREDREGDDEGAGADDATTACRDARGSAEAGGLARRRRTRAMARGDRRARPAARRRALRAACAGAGRAAIRARPPRQRAHACARRPGGAASSCRQPSRTASSPAALATALGLETASLVRSPRTASPTRRTPRRAPRCPISRTRPSGSRPGSAPGVVSQFRHERGS